MRILIAHNRYRSGTPSGENRVVDQESDALAALGHEVVRFGRSSDEIEQWSVVKKASLPAQLLWNRRSHRDLTAALREHRPDVVHVHNTFPLLSAAVLYACRIALMAAIRLAGLPGKSYEMNGAVTLALEDPDSERRWLAGEDILGGTEAGGETPPDAAAIMDRIVANVAPTV